MRTARRYLASEIYRTFAVVLLALLALFTLFSLIEELDSVSEKFTLWNLFYLEALATPSRIYDLLPIGLLIGSILALASLAQRNELVIIRVSGVSGIRLLFNLWLITLPLVGGALILSEVITPRAEIQYSEASLRLLGKAGGGRLNSGYWFKESDADQRTRIININSLQAGGSVTGISLFEFNANYELESFSTAKSGSFNGNQLTLNQVVRTDISPTALQALQDAKAHAEPLTELSHEDRTLTTTLTAERLLARVLTPEKMSVLTLLDYISYLKNNYLQTDRQVVALWRKLAYPATMLVMITIAAPIGFMQTRRGGVGGKVFIGILLGVGFFMINQLALNVGILSGWAPWVTALLPNIIVWILALTALLVMENKHNIKRIRYQLWPGQPA